MSGLEEALRTLIGDLEEESLSFCLVGGLAVSIHAEPRLTRDVDVVVSVRGDDEAEDVVRRISARGYVIGAVLQHETQSRLSAVRMTHPDRPAVVLDLLFASSGIEPEIVERAQQIEALPGLTVLVAAVGDLIALKLLARDDRSRPADLDDLRSLTAIATPEDVATAEGAVGLIHERGFDRGRDLPDALRRLIEAEDVKAE